MKTGKLSKKGVTRGKRGINRMNIIMIFEVFKEVKRITKRKMGNKVLKKGNEWEKW